MYFYYYPFLGCWKVMIIPSSGKLYEGISLPKRKQNLIINNNRSLKRNREFRMRKNRV